MLCLLRFLAFNIGYTSSLQISANTSQSDAITTGFFLNTNKIENTSQTQLIESTSNLNGNETNFDDENDYLDLSVVDVETAKKILKVAQKNYANFNETEEKPIERDGKKPDETFYPVPFFIKKALDLMEQSVYSTRYRLQDTKDIRKRFADDLCYNIAIFYGSLMQLRMKMDNLYATMMKFPYPVKFVWFLGLYERSVAMNVDVTYMVEAMFKMHAKYRTFGFGESVEKGGS